MLLSLPGGLGLLLNLTIRRGKGQNSMENQFIVYPPLIMSNPRAGLALIVEASICDCALTIFYFHVNLVQEAFLRNLEL